MSYSEISGLELFQMPFSSHSARQPQAARHQDTGRRQHTTEAQSKAPQQQSGHQHVLQKPAEQDAKPTAAAEYKPDITPPKRNAEEIKNAKPAAEAKEPASVQDNKTQAKIPERQPSPELNQKEPAAADTTKSPVYTEQKEQPETQQKELVLDMSSGSVASGDGKSGNADDTAKRKAHEAAEAKRKAEWEAKQLAKKQAEAAAIQKLQSMSDDDVISASTQRISMDVERITRRNLKECVAEHIQGLCRKDPAFARLTMHPSKSMINCFKYINRQAKEFVKQEMEDNGIKQDNDGYGCDVPDGIVYQWAESYFNDPNAKEDTEKEEKFMPKPYTGAAKPKNAASKTKKPAKKKEEKRSEQSGNYEQMTLGV